MQIQIDTCFFLAVQTPFYKEKLIRWNSVKLCACLLMKARFMRTSSFGGYLCEINDDNDDEDSLWSQISMIVTCLNLNNYSKTNYHLGYSGHTCIFLAVWLLLKDAVKHVMSIHSCSQTACFFFDWQSACTVWWWCSYCCRIILHAHMPTYHNHLFHISYASLHHSELENYWLKSVLISNLTISNMESRRTSRAHPEQHVLQCRNQFQLDPNSKCSSKRKHTGSRLCL